MTNLYLLAIYLYHFCLHFLKYFKKTFLNRFISFFQEKQLFYNGQYVFRTEHSTELAALELIDRVMVEMDNDNTPISIFW